MIGLELFPDFGSGFNSRVSGRVGYSIFGFQLSVSTEIGFRPSVFEFRDRDSAGWGPGLGFRVWGSNFRVPDPLHMHLHFFNDLSNIIIAYLKICALAPETKHFFQLFVLFFDKHKLNNNTCDLIIPQLHVGSL